MIGPGMEESYCMLSSARLFDIRSGTVKPENLPDYLFHSTMFPRRSEATNLNDTMKSAERFLIEQTLRQVDGNKTKTAALLGIHRTLLYRKMKILGIDL